MEINKILETVLAQAVSERTAELESEATLLRGKVKLLEAQAAKAQERIEAAVAPVQAELQQTRQRLSEAEQKVASIKLCDCSGCSTSKGTWRRMRCGLTREQLIERDRIDQRYS